MVARPPIIKLSWKDKGAFVSVMENAFSPDPLFNKLFIRNQTSLTAAYRVQAFLSFVFEMSMLSGADVRGIFDGDRLVGCYILEVPVKNPFRRIGGAILVLIRALVLPYQNLYRVLQTCERLHACYPGRGPPSEALLPHNDWRS